LNRAEVTELQDNLVHSIIFPNPNERFSFKDSYAYLFSDILNECEIVGTLSIFVKSKEISSLSHYGYYTHSYEYTHTHTRSCPRSTRRDKCNS
jgi:hypothetical protein